MSNHQPRGTLRRLNYRQEGRPLFGTQTEHKSLLGHNCIMLSEETGDVLEYSNEKPTSAARFVIPKLHSLKFKSGPQTEKQLLHGYHVNTEGLSCDPLRFVVRCIWKQTRVFKILFCYCVYDKSGEI